MILRKEGKRSYLGNIQIKQTGDPSGLAVRDRNLGKTLMDQAVKSGGGRSVPSDLQN